MSEHEIAGVMGRYAHNGAGAISGKHVIADIYRYALSIQTVDGITPCENSRLFFFHRQPVNLRGLPGFGDVLVDSLLILGRGQARNQRVLRGQHDECHTEDSVYTGSEGADLFFLQSRFRYIKAYLYSLAAANPILLHRQDLFWPFF